MEKCRMAATESRQDLPHSGLKLLNVINSDEVRCALIEKRRPTRVILIKIRHVDVLFENEFSNRAKNSESISFVEHHYECSSSDEVVSHAFKCVARPVIGSGLLA